MRFLPAFALSAAAGVFAFVQVPLLQPSVETTPVAHTVVLAQVSTPPVLLQALTASDGVYVFQDNSRLSAPCVYFTAPLAGAAPAQTGRADGLVEDQTMCAGTPYVAWANVKTSTQIRVLGAVEGPDTRALVKAQSSVAFGVMHLYRFLPATDAQALLPPVIAATGLSPWQGTIVARLDDSVLLRSKDTTPGGFAEVYSVVPDPNPGLNLANSAKSEVDKVGEFQGDTIWRVRDHGARGAPYVYAMTTRTVSYAVGGTMASVPAFADTP